MASIVTLAFILKALLVLKLYLKWCKGVCRSGRQLSGKTVIITGANSGIGLETARELARRKARVILACRSLRRGEEAARDIVQSTGNQDVVVRQLDLSSMASVREFADDIGRSERKLNILVNNAGMSTRPGRIHRTEDGLEVQFATNHLGHFLLVQLLLPLLKKSAPSRVVVVSSCTHLWATIDMDNLNQERYYRDPYWVYCTTKLANLLFTRALAKRLEGSGVTVNALHPGAVWTGIARNSHWFVRYLIVPIMYPFAKSASEGAETVVHLAVSDDLDQVSGKYFADCRESWTSPQARDDALAEALWKKSEYFVGSEWKKELLRIEAIERKANSCYG